MKEKNICRNLRAHVYNKLSLHFLLKNTQKKITETFLKFYETKIVNFKNENKRSLNGCSTFSF